MRPFYLLGTISIAWYIILKRIIAERRILNFDDM